MEPTKKGRRVRCYVIQETEPGATFEMKDGALYGVCANSGDGNRIQRLNKPDNSRQGRKARRAARRAAKEAN